MSFSGNERDPLFVNLGDGGFENRGYQARVDLPGDGRSQVWADLDGDGDLDLVVRQLQTPKVVVLRNDGTPGHRAIEVSLRGVGDNRMGVGAVVKACVGERCQVQEIHAGSGFMSQAPAVAHFGLGEAAAAQVSVVWPSGEAQVLGTVPAGAKVRATQGKSGFDTLETKSFALGPADPPALTLQALAHAGGDDALAAAAKLGKPVVVNLWAPWCKPCRQEAPRLDAFAKNTPGVQAVGLAMDVGHGSLAAAAKTLGLSWPVAQAKAAQKDLLGRALDSIELPTTLAFDAQGHLVGGVVGGVTDADLVRLGQVAAGSEKAKP